MTVSYKIAGRGLIEVRKNGKSVGYIAKGAFTSTKPLDSATKICVAVFLRGR